MQRSITQFCSLMYSLTICLYVISGCSKTQRQQEVGLAQPDKDGLVVVKGRVFLITKGGDLKPTRLADIYLLSAQALPDGESVKSETRLIESECKWADDSRERLARHPEISELITKHKDEGLARYRTGLYKLQALFYSEKGQKDTFAAEADEEGRFSFPRVPSGSYAVVAFGQAGVNLGYWEQSLQIDGAEPPELKLSEPVTACSML